MPRYRLNALGDAEFERMAQSLLKAVIGSGTITFGPGKDGAREATYEGRAPYPSKAEQWSGKWIFQVKFHDTDLIGMPKARANIVADLESELNTITTKYKYDCQNYILITNVSLSGVHATGTIDKIENTVFPKYRRKIPNLAVWSADDVNGLLDKHPEIRTAFLPLLVSGDVIAELLDLVKAPKTERATTIDAYLRTIIRREENAQLDQAGDVGEDPIVLQKIFFDLDTYVQGLTKQAFSRLGGRVPLESLPVSDETRAQLVWLLINSGLDRVVVVGGPGEGKSTLGQYLSQIHRATLLGKAEDVAVSADYIPDIPRLPFRVVLRDFAQWLAGHSSDSGESDSLDTYISIQVARTSSRQFSERDLHEVLRSNPALLVLDGLDEVTDATVRKRLIARLSEFVERAEDTLRADVQVIATTRPTGYNDQFDPKTFIHFRLGKLRAEQVREYSVKWAAARNLDEDKNRRLQLTIEECLNDNQISLLMTTPLQVTILILIINSGGTPPRQREALFDEYLEVIYKREKAKGLGIIKSEKELLIGLHKYVGYLLQEESTRASTSSAVLPRPEYDKVVMSYLRRHDPYTPDKLMRAEWKAITVDAGERLVLIVESPADIFGFELRSIQEFFAACYIADTAEETAQRYMRFDAIARMPHWRNVALFFAGRVGRVYPGEASNVVEVCREVDRSGVDIFVRRGAELALELSADRALEPNRVLQRSLLEHGMGVFDSKLSAHTRTTFIDLVQRLPFEDIRDHVLPILDDRLRVVGQSGMLNISYLLAALRPTSAALRRTLLRIAASPGKDRIPEIMSIISVTGIPNDVRIEVVRKMLESGVDPSAIGNHLSDVPWDLKCSIALSLISSDISDVMAAPFAEAVARGFIFASSQSVYLGLDELPEHPLSLLLRTGKVFHETLSTRRYHSMLIYDRGGNEWERMAAELPEEVRLGTFDDEYPSQGGIWFLWMSHFCLGQVSPDSWDRYYDWRLTHEIGEVERMSSRFIGEAFSPVVRLLATSTPRDLASHKETALTFGGASGIHEWGMRLRELRRAFGEILSDEEGSLFYRFGPGALTHEKRPPVQAILDGLLGRDLHPLALEFLRDDNGPIPHLSEHIVQMISDWFNAPKEGAPWNLEILAYYVVMATTSIISPASAVMDVFLRTMPPQLLAALALRFSNRQPKDSAGLHRFIEEIVTKADSATINHAYLRGPGLDPRRMILSILHFIKNGETRVVETSCSLIIAMCRSFGDDISRGVINREAPIRSRELDQVQKFLIANQSVLQREAGISLYSVRPPRSSADWMQIGALLQSAGSQEICNLWAWVIPAAAELSNRPEPWIDQVTALLTKGVSEEALVAMSDVLRTLLQKQSQSLGELSSSLGLPQFS